MNRKFVILLMSHVVSMSTAVSIADAQTKPVSSTLTIDAPMKQVWNALHSERMLETQTKHVVSKHGADSVISECFQHLPMIGDAQCTWLEHEVPNSSVVYHLVSSDKFDVFEGAWSLTPTGNGAATVLTLTSMSSIGLNVPFKDRVIRSMTLTYVKHKLDDVRRAVSVEIASNPQQPQP